MAREKMSSVEIVLDTAKRYISQSEKLNGLRQRAFLSIQFASSAIGLVAAAKRIVNRGAKSSEDLDALTQVAKELLSEAATIYKANVVSRWCGGYPGRARQNPDLLQAMWEESERETAVGVDEMERIAGL
jgi:hypothetical protein